MRLPRWKIYLWIGWTGFATGICFLLLAIGFAAYEGWFLKQSSKAQGTRYQQTCRSKAERMRKSTHLRRVHSVRSFNMRLQMGLRM
jgi:hypothetical protein